MELLWKHWEAHLSLLMGGYLLISTVADLVRYKRATFGGIIVALSLSAALFTIGLVGLLELVRSIWIMAAFNAVWGILAILLSLGLPTREPGWVWVTSAVMGCLVILAAIGYIVKPEGLLR